MVVLLPLIGALNVWIIGPGSTMIIAILVSLIGILVTIYCYRFVQTFVERSILGVSLPPRDLPELYSERITTSTSLSGLQTILETEILPRLHVRQFAFLRVEYDVSRVQHLVGVDAKEMPIQNALAFANASAGIYRPPETVDAANDPFAWVRLVLELKVAGEPVGLWLFGRRDPDDFYSHAEIALLQSLANQTAIALSNIQQTQRVLEMYQMDIGRHEQERMRLALELHDSILNQVAALQMHLDDSAITPQFQADYDELTGRLREIVHDLRPAMLNYGLKPALDELVESLLERDKNGLACSLELQPDENRYSAEVEQHLFRIAQEACENALRHGKARRISIHGALLPDEITLSIVDNGAGFDAGKGFDMAGLLANKHFGLAGMLERARLIGGDVRIDSSPTTGTRVSFQWAQPKA